MDKQFEQKMWTYIKALEGVNEQLVFTRTRCAKLLTQLQPTQAGHAKWKALLDDIQGVIRVGKRITQQKPKD